MMERWDDIIFKNRNTDYGAYEHRKHYNRGVLSGVLVTIILVGIACAAMLYEPDDEKTQGWGGNTQYEVNINKPPAPLAQNKIELPPIGGQRIKKTEIIKPLVSHNPDQAIDLNIDTENNQKGDTAGTGTANGNGNNNNGESEQGNGDGPAPVFVKVEVAPQFPGGEKERHLFLQANVKYPPLARQYKVQGTVFATFIVEKDGKLSNIKILQGIGCGCDDEVSRVVHMMPAWIPGKQNGQAVRVQMLMPVSFYLTVQDGKV